MSDSRDRKNESAGEGVLLKDGAVVQYTVATIDLMTFFYA